MSFICIGPKGAGKTHLLTALKNCESIDNTTYSIPTVGTNIFTIKLPIQQKIEGDTTKTTTTTTSTTTTSSTTSSNKKEKIVKILEIGGSMAPLWRRYFNNVDKIIYVVDTSNLCQISAAGVLLYSILAEPRLQRSKILLVLTKMDLAYRQMRNEALLMLQMVKLKKQVRQSLTIVEASSIGEPGLGEVYKWLNLSVSAKSNY